MGYIFALAGKGGTGKTTIAAFLADYLRKAKKGSVLAIDADPNANLNQALGLELNGTVVGILDKLASLKDAGLPAGMTKNRFIEYEIQNSISEGDGFDLLAMGRPEGPGCYCYANTVLRGIIERLSKAYDYVVIDNEAGMEHLSRRTARVIDKFFIISDFSPVGVAAAKRISDLAKEMELKIADERLIVNMARGGADQLKEAIDKASLRLECVLPFDEEIANLSLAGKPVIGSIKSDAKRIFERISWQSN